jgi:hypothetical protein
MTAATVTLLLCVFALAGTSATWAFLNDPGVQRDRRRRVRSPGEPAQADESIGDEMLVTGRMPDGSHGRAGLLPLCAVADRLGDRDQVALAVVEERAELAAAAAGVHVKGC